MVLKRKIFSALFVFICTVSFSFAQIVNSGNTLSNDIWRAGIAKKIITPENPVWMAGYASRTAPSEGKLHDLWAKAIVLEDKRGHRSLLVTMDLVGIPAVFSENLRNEIKSKYGFDKSQIILSTSHTHSGPVLTGMLEFIYPMKTDDWQQVNEYTEWLKNKLLELVGECFKEIEPVRIFTQNGITRFQVNRRNNNESALTPETVLNGPSDYSVPVTKIENTDNELKAVIFGYACHPTVLSINQFSGDYPGFAQIELEKMYPGVTAMFFQGSAGDQNPLPRRSVSLAVQYGKELAAAVERVLSEDMVKQENKLETLYTEVELPLDQPLPVEQYEEIAKGNDYQARWAKGMLNDYKRNGSFIKTYTYPIGCWKIGNQHLLFTGGEATISYTLNLKKMFGSNIFVMSYANDVMAYIPSALIIEEGGYEGDTSQRAYGLPAKWDKQIEPLILNSFREMLSE